MDYDKVVDFIIRVGFPIFALIVIAAGVSAFTVKYAWPFVTKLITDSIAGREKERLEHQAQIAKLLADRDAERTILTTSIQKAELERVKERENFNTILGSYQGAMNSQTTEFGRVVTALSGLTTVIHELNNNDRATGRELLDGLDEVRRQLRKTNT